MKRRRLTLADRDLEGLAAGIAKQHHATLEEVLGRGGRQHVRDARNHIYSELYDMLRSNPAVGELLGRHHTSVISGRRAWALVTGEVL